jgi:membrane fusion protein, heavy metal efflux system
LRSQLLFRLAGRAIQTESTMKIPTAFAVLALTAGLLAAGGCKPAEKKTDSHPSPAKVATIAQEGQLNTIQLTEEAKDRLGITLAPVEKREVSRVRSYGGEIALPPGASLVISAPVGGKLQAASTANVPTVGMLVSARQPIFLLTPLLSPERDVLTPAERISMAQAKNVIITTRIEAAGQVATAREQVAAAKIALERAERLFRDAAGTAKAVDDAKAQLNLANATLQAAEERQKAVDSINLEGSEAGQQTPLVIESPQSGMIRAQNAAPGEVVAAGAPLFEVMKYDPVWVRVPVYAGETSQLALDQPAEVVPLNADGISRGHTAEPIAAPPTATLLAATVDLYYRLANPEGHLRPGERMTVRVKLRGASEQRVVPWSAVMHDIHGGTWVYEKTAPLTYVRRRVQVRYVVDDLAALESGPALGAQIVISGSVELFGTEFGFAK